MQIGIRSLEKGKGSDVLGKASVKMKISTSTICAFKDTLCRSRDLGFIHSSFRAHEQKGSVPNQGAIAAILLAAQLSFPQLTNRYPHPFLDPAVSSVSCLLLRDIA